MKDAYPLSWPDGWKRVRIQDRQGKGAWKKTLLQYKKDLEKELGRIEAKGVIITCNIQPNQMASYGPEPRDPSVAVYFSILPKEDYSWQDTLNVHDPNPTMEQITSAYRDLARRYHSDIPGGDVEMMKEINLAYQKAKAWITNEYAAEHQHVIACDRYKEVRLNMNAITITLRALRSIENSGASSLLERAYKGFAAITEGESHGPSTTS